MLSNNIALCSSFMFFNISGALNPTGAFSAHVTTIHTFIFLYFVLILLYFSRVSLSEFTICNASLLFIIIRHIFEFSIMSESPSINLSYRDSSSLSTVSKISFTFSGIMSYAYTLEFFSSSEYSLSTLSQIYTSVLFGYNIERAETKYFTKLILSSIYFPITANKPSLVIFTLYHGNQFLKIFICFMKKCRI